MKIKLLKAVFQPTIFPLKLEFSSNSVLFCFMINAVSRIVHLMMFDLMNFRSNRKSIKLRTLNFEYQIIGNIVYALASQTETL